MSRKRCPRIVLAADVFVDSIVSPSGNSADLMNIVLDGHAVPVMDSRMSMLYSAIMGSTGLGFPDSIVQDVMLKLDRISDFISPVPATCLPADLPCEDALYFQLALSAGGVPVIKRKLHFYLDSQVAKDIPIFTPGGYIRKTGFIDELLSINRRSTIC
jgi:hypothetical protein